jgi:hypothetical protein
MQQQRTTKRCPRCGEEKPIGDFYVSKGKVSCYCKECTKAHVRAYNRRMPAEVRERKNTRGRAYAKLPYVRERVNARVRGRMATDPEFRLRQAEQCRRYYANHKDAVKARNAAYPPKPYKGNTPEVIARRELNRAITNGRVERPSTCSACSKPCTPHGHHHNGYDNWYDVIWLCASCHKLLHMRGVTNASN